MVKIARVGDVRRVVTAERADGSSYVAIDGPQVRIWGNIAALWATENGRSVLPLRGAADDMTPGLATMFGAPGETRVGVLLFPPEGDPPPEGDSLDITLRPTGKTAGAGWHATYSYDYLFIVSGELWMFLDEEEVLLKAGDVVVQGGVNHAWRNKGNVPCLMYSVTLGVPESS
jgi:mannose-6-phosphate isomerase-like protein (cupin superfamily)